MNPTASRRTVLVVDDSKAACELVYWSLGGPSSIFHLVPLNSAKRALDVLQDTIVDLVITDYRMPEIDGITFAQMIRSDPRLSRTPIIMMSGEWDAELIAAARSAGISSLLSKPFTPSELLASVDEALDGHNSVDHLAAGQLTIQTLLDSIPHLAMVLDENHRVILGNKRFFALGEAGIDECPVQCVHTVHGDAGMPEACPLVESVATEAPCERLIDDPNLGTLMISVYPLDITTEDGRRLFLHIEQPTPAL